MPPQRIHEKLYIARGGPGGRQSENVPWGRLRASDSPGNIFMSFVKHDVKSSVAADNTGDNKGQIGLYAVL